jgi:hypothetical protein
MARGKQQGERFGKGKLMPLKPGLVEVQLKAPLKPGLQPPAVIDKPPGLPTACNDMPPGLTPPGLSIDEVCASIEIPTIPSPLYVLTSEEDTQVSESPRPPLVMVHRVAIAGLPNAMLSEKMFEVVLAQANLDDQFTHFITSPGKVSGEAMVMLKTAQAAEQCIRHFQGRPWGPRGDIVCARWLPCEAATRPVCKAPAKSVPAPSRKTAAADSPAFVPEPSVSKLIRPTSKMSAAAPAFVPGKGGGRNTSDVSTVDGGSEPDSENDGAAGKATA